MCKGMLLKRLLLQEQESTGTVFFLVFEEPKKERKRKDQVALEPSTKANSILVLSRLAWYFTDTFGLVYSFTQGLFAFVVSLGFDGRDYFSCIGIWRKAIRCIFVYAC
jgi:hypothetical protein